MAINTSKIKVKTTIGNNKKVSVKLNSTDAKVNLNNNGNIVSTGRLDLLVDVDATNEANGSVLVYNSDNDKYEVKPLDFDIVTGDLDAGTF